MKDKKYAYIFVIFARNVNIAVVEESSMHYSSEGSSTAI